MFLVVGQRPAGTSAVGAALDRHPGLAVVGAGELIVPMAFVLDRVGDAEAARTLLADLVIGSRGFAAGIGAHLDAEGVRAALAEGPVRLGPLLTRLYAAVAAAAGVSAAGTVFPRLGMGVLARTGLYAGGVRFVHVVRDARTVVAGHEGAEPAEVLARRWDVQNRQFRDRWGQDPATYRLVRFEDVVARPVAALTEVARFLGADGDAPAVTVDADEPARPLDAETRRLVTQVAAEGLFDFGYDPPARSPRRLVRTVGRRAGALSRRSQRGVTLLRDRAWVLRAPVLGAPAPEAAEVQRAWCNVCRWSGEAFAGHAHAESADCPRCGTIARQRFLLHCLGREDLGRSGRVLEVAPRLHGAYGRAMARWYDYRPLEPADGTEGLGHLEALRAVPDRSVDVVLSAHDLQSVPDVDGALAELGRVLVPGGRLLLQVPLLAGVTERLDVAPTAPRGTARWSFGVDLHERVAAAGLAAELLVPDELAELVAGDPAAWAKAQGSGELDLDSLLPALAAAPVVGVADRPTARRCGWAPVALFPTLRATRPEVTP